MALAERIITIPNYLRHISGIDKVTQKQGSGVVTVHYMEGLTECAVYSGNILDSVDDMDKLADIVELVRKENGHAVNSHIIL